MRKDLSNNIKKIMVVYLILILGLITYVVYFSVFKSPEIAEMPNNSRLWAKRNEVLRGTIYDRDGNALTKGERTGTLTQSREYVYGDMFAHILGYADQRYGLTGLENLYDKELTDYQTLSIKSFLESLDFRKELENRDNKDKKVGNGVVTTLDTNIQEAAYKALSSSAIKKAAVVAINPKTGEILASVSKPFYNPNDLENEMKKSQADMAKPPKEQMAAMLNRAVSGMYPPGSVFKVVTLASALENISGITNRTFSDNGKITFKDGTTLPNQGGKSYGSISLKKAVSVSSNVVFGNLALELGNDKLKATAEKFGFNEKVSRDGVVIETSRFPTYSNSEKGTIARSGIGQADILATPMEMALVASTIANNGVMMEPHLVNKVVDREGNTVRTIDPKEFKTVIPQENAAIIKNYMKGVVDDRVNSNWKYFRGTNAAGKTGTAENHEGDGTPHAWFIGFAPADDPKIAVAVIVENGGAGSGIASKIAGDVINTALGK